MWYILLVTGKQKSCFPIIAPTAQNEGFYMVDRIWDIYSSDFLGLYKRYNPQDWVIKHCNNLDDFNYQDFLTWLGPNHKFKDACEYNDVFVIETAETTSCGFDKDRLYFVINRP